MSHEITSTDNVVLHGERAWHGLGIIVKDAPTPREALKLAGIDWGVEQWPIVAVAPDGRQFPVDTHLVNIRGDDESQLGVVTSGYKPVSNADMADFCQALADNNSVRVETAGSIRGGKRVWFLLKGEAFNVANGDEIYPYVLVSNGHDGGSSFRVTPTTIRTVCSNTLHAVIPREDTGDLGSSAICIQHRTNIMDRIEDAKLALKHYHHAIEETQKVVNVLVASDVNSESVQRFFLECYTADFGEIPDNPQDKKEERQRDKATSAFNSFSRRFDDERAVAGSNLWNAFNAYSGLVQHDMKARGKNDADRIEKRVTSNLFGLNSERTSSAIQLAYAMAN